MSILKDMPAGARAEMDQKSAAMSDYIDTLTDQVVALMEEETPGDAAMILYALLVRTNFTGEADPIHRFAGMAAFAVTPAGRDQDQRRPRVNKPGKPGKPCQIDPRCHLAQQNDGTDHDGRCELGDDADELRAQIAKLTARAEAAEANAVNAVATAFIERIRPRDDDNAH